MMGYDKMTNLKKTILGGLGFSDESEYSGTLYQLNFAVTYYCESRCKNCLIWTRGKGARNGELTLDEIQKFASLDSDYRWIRFTGGEPFIREDLPQIIQAFVNKSKKLNYVNITTNAFNPEKFYPWHVQSQNLVSKIL